MEKLEIENEVEKIPRKSGIYFFFDKDNQLMYVGKAQDLYWRIDKHIKDFRKYEDAKEALEFFYAKYSIQEIIKFEGEQKTNYELFSLLYKSGTIIDKILDRVKKIEVEEYRKEKNEQKEKELIQSLKPPFNSQTACKEYYKIGKGFDVFERELLQLWESGME